LKAWNHTVGDTKFVNELVFFALAVVQVYTLAFLADILIVNSIEFWSGENPADEIGSTKTVKGENGDEYTIVTLENGYSISREGQESVQLIHNEETNTWSVVKDDMSIDLVKINDDGTAQLYLPKGESMKVSLDEKGMLAAREVVLNKTYLVSR